MPAEEEVRVVLPREVQQRVDLVRLAGETVLVHRDHVADVPRLDRGEQREVSGPDFLRVPRRDPVVRMERAQP